MCPERVEVVPCQLSSLYGILERGLRPFPFLGLLSGLREKTHTSSIHDIGVERITIEQRRSGHDKNLGFHSLGDSLCGTA